MLASRGVKDVLEVQSELLGDLQGLSDGKLRLDAVEKAMGVRQGGPGGGSMRSSSCLGRKPPRAPQLEETPETPPSDRKSVV